MRQLHIRCSLLAGKRAPTALELIGISPTTIRALRAAGIQTIDDLAQVDLGSDTAIRIKQAEGFDENLGQVVALLQRDDPRFRVGMTTLTTFKFGPCQIQVLASSLAHEWPISGLCGCISLSTTTTRKIALAR